MSRRAFALLVAALTLSTASLLSCVPPEGGEGQNRVDNLDANGSTTAPPTSTDGARIEGFVVDENGDPMDTAHVMLRSVDDPEVVAVNRSDSGGYFMVGDVPPGTYEAGVQTGNAEAYEFRETELESGTTEIVFDSLYDGDDDPTASLSARSSGEMATFRGEVVDAEGTPLPYAKVLLNAGSSSGGTTEIPYAATTAGEEGTFSLQGLHPGSYTPTIAIPGGDDFTAASIEVEGGGETSRTIAAPEGTDTGSENGEEEECPGDETFVEYDGDQFCAASCSEDEECDSDRVCTDNFCIPESQ